MLFLASLLSAAVNHSSKKYIISRTFTALGRTRDRILEFEVPTDNFVLDDRVSVQTRMQISSAKIRTKSIRFPTKLKLSRVSAKSVDQ